MGSFVFFEVLVSIVSFELEIQRINTRQKKKKVTPTPGQRQEEEEEKEGSKHRLINRKEKKVRTPDREANREACRRLR